MNKVTLRGGTAENAGYWIGALSLIGAAVTAAAAFGYTAAWPDYFFLFGLAAIGQLLYGLLFLLQPWYYQAGEVQRGEPAGYRLPAAGLGLLANLAFLGTFIFTRARGLPFGPLARQALPLRPLGLVFLLTEALLVLALAYFLGGQRARMLAVAGQR